MAPVRDSLQILQRHFLAGLPDRIAKLRSKYQELDLNAWQPAKAGTLHLQLHSLTGSSGTFGLQSLSVVARKVEQDLKVIVEAGVPPDEETWHKVGAELDRVEQLALARLHAKTANLPPPPVPPRPDNEPLVYLVEDDPVQAEHLARSLSEGGYQVQVYTALDEFRAAWNDGASPGAIVLDMVFPGGNSAGVKLLEELKAGAKRLPPVVFVSVRDDLDARLAAYRAGAQRYLTKPIALGALTDCLDELTGRMPLDPYRVLLVDDDPLILEAEATVLRAAGMTVRAISQPRETLQVLTTFKPDVVVLDVYMPDVTGPELAAVVREQENYLSLPILFLSAETDIHEQLQALNLGGDDFLVKPVKPEHLISAVTARARRARQSGAVQRRLQTTLYEREREHLTLDYHALVSVTDARGIITEVNDRFCQVSGFSRDELLGQNHRIVKSGEHPREFYREIWQTIAEGDVWQGEICNRRKDGTLYWVSTTITPFLDSSGRPYQYVSIRTNITEVKNREAAQRRESALRSMIAKAAAELLSADASGLDHTIEAVLGRAGQHLGVDRAYLFLLSEDGLRMSNTHEWCADGIDAQKDQLQDIPLNSAPWWWAQILQKQWILISDVRTLPQEAEAEKSMFESLGLRALCGFPIRQGSHTLGFLGFDQVGSVRDWHRARAESFGMLASLIGSSLERAKSERLAGDAKERLRRGQMFANIGTWEWNIATGDLFWTERIAPLFGYPTGELETSYENFLGAIHPEDRQLVMDAVDAAVNRGAPYDIEHRVVWPDGTVRWLSERGAVVRDAEGEALTMLGVVQDIHDRKMAELGLTERQRKLEEAQSLALLGNWRADFESGSLTWSDQVYRIFGYDPGAITVDIERFYTAVHPDDLPSLREDLERAKETGRHDLVHRIIRPSGEIRYVHELANAGVNDQGELMWLAGTIQDITERVESERQLRETEARFAFAVEGAGDAVWEWDVASGKMVLSDTYEPMLGFSQGELSPTINGWVEQVHPEDLGEVQQQLQTCMGGGGQQLSIELRMRCKSGHYKWVLCRATVAEKSTSGEPRRLIGIHSDIDERKANEQTLQIFKHVVNSVADGVLVFDFEGRIQLASPAASRIFGHSTSAMKGNSISMLLAEGLYPEWRSHLRSYVIGEESGLLNRQVELTGKRSDGSEFPIEVAVNDIQLEKTRYFVSLVRDITERKRAQEDLIIAREEADRANQAKSDFLSSMSHELRTPMNAILGFGQLMQYDDHLPDEHNESVTEILRAGEHLLALINEVLDLAKVESGNIDLSLEPVALQPIIDECLTLVTTMVEKRHIKINVRSVQQTAVRADRVRFKQVLLNLLSNAIKYNREGGQVTVDTELAPDNRLRVRVSDTGPGIAEAKLAELFQPFNRLDAEASDIEGTGIGLTITQRIMDMMGGSVGVDSELGVGSTFWLDLPLESASEDESENGTDVLETRVSGTCSTSSTAQTVLYVEDNPANLKLVTQILGRLPHLRLLTAHTASLGLELAQARNPDLILLDINLPGMDGYQVMDVLKADANLKNIPVIAVTANAMPKDLERGEAAGFVEYLTKPLDVPHFLQTVKSLLEGG